MPPEKSCKAFDFDAKHIVFLGRTTTDFVFERPNWWVKQIRELATFYLRAEFGDGEIDYRDYRTSIDISGRSNLATFRRISPPTGWPRPWSRR